MPSFLPDGLIRATEEAKARGDAAEMRHLRSEAFNLFAAEARRVGDDFPIYLMAMIEGAEKKGFPFTANMLLVCFAFYAADPELLEALASAVQPQFMEANHTMGEIMKLKQIKREAGIE